MKDAAQYAINFPYGATSPPYSAASPHRGNDRPCPMGTPIIIEGVTIGLTGATGQVTGPHLHIQEWGSNYTSTRKPQNEFKPGTVTLIDPSGTVGDGSFGKFITIQNSDGWSDSYCHLSQISVKVGDVIGDEMPTEQDINFLWVMILDKPPAAQDVSYWKARTYSELLTALFNGERNALRKTNVQYAYKLAFNRDPTQDEYNFWTGRYIGELEQALFKDPKSAVNTAPANVTKLTPGQFYQA